MAFASRQPMRRACVLVVILASAPALADPLTFAIGVGVREQIVARDLKASPEAAPMVDPTDLSASATALVGYRLRPDLALGLRLGLGRLDVEQEFGNRSGTSSRDGYIRMPVDLAATVQ